jgi:hypothetical protein
MPGVTLHLQLADRTLERWRRTGRAPFPLDDAGAVNAFRQGAFGPDLGYFPGGPAPLSDLAHAVRSADLCRSLVKLASNPIERAYAWGWISHVLADLAVHPILGCAVGELVHGTAGRFVAGDANPEAHGRVEAGLDALYASRAPGLRSSAPAPSFSERSIRYLAAAYHDVYGIELESARLLRAHRGAVRRAGQGLVLAALTSRTLSDRPALRTGAGEGWLRKRLAGSSLATAYVFPVRPPQWLLAAVRAALRPIPRLLTESWILGLAWLENRNLDTGSLEEVSSDHGAALRARRFLATSAAARLATAA